jgi:hypothetical protein
MAGMSACSAGRMTGITVHSRPYDLPCVQIRKSDDLRNPGAKSRVVQVLLAQSLAMQIISALGSAPFESHGGIDVLKDG